MTDNQPANLDKQIDQLLEYIDQECVGVDVFSGRHGFNYDNAKAAIRQLLVAERIKALDWVMKLDNDDFMHAGCPPTYPIEVEMTRLEAALQSQLTDGGSV